ncbi:hypothetical protein QRD43_13990 [Pelomonas sp. APW6]|uniref:DUF5671 domain-containing protein n=1 Tax=Roseateles subflavus TaxID=3053353 RepID=A0ABT7LJI3_9BURK|nr:hypothetical protein [Pelomonas sp. APW6]MDL5033022.1 hypothetical protein [Pelomonas sp. APW6]
MQSHRRPLAFLSGFAVYVGGLAAAMAAAAAPLSWLLVGRTDLLALVLRLSALALPSLLMALAWTYFSLRSRQRSRRQTWLWYRIGMGLAMVVTFTGGFFALAQLDATKVWSPFTLLTSARMPPFWGLQNSLAILLGAWLGHRLLPARQRVHPHGTHVEEWEAGLSRMD